MLHARLLSFNDLASLPPPKWLIEGMFEAQSLVMVAGPPGHYKSFIALDWMLCMVTGRKWNGHAVQASKVLYILGEGKASLYKRMSAWMKVNGVSESDLNLIQENFRIMFDVPQFNDRISMIKYRQDMEASGFKPDVIVIDTFARSFVGKDENSSQDTGVWIEIAEAMRHEGKTVMFLHHTAKNTNPEAGGLRYRGSSALLGAVDTSFLMMFDKGVVTLSNNKQKDHEEVSDIHFAIRQVSEVDSMALVPTIKVDDSLRADRAEKEAEIDQVMRDVVYDPTYESDRARARALSEQLGADRLSFLGAQARIKRLREAERMAKGA